MYSLLHQYLIIHKQLDLPGVGLLQVIDVPARYNAAEKKIYAPHPAIRCKAERMEVDNILYSWIAKQLSISVETAQNQFHTFINNILGELAKHNQTTWKGLGIFTKNDTGIIRFAWEKTIQQYLPSITATKIIRNGTSHNLLVGAHEATSIEMEQWLSQDASPLTKKHRWFWVMATVIVVAISISIYYLIQDGVSFETITTSAKYIFLTLGI